MPVSPPGPGGVAVPVPAGGSHRHGGTVPVTQACQIASATERPQAISKVELELGVHHDPSHQVQVRHWHIEIMIMIAYCAYCAYYFAYFAYWSHQAMYLF